MLRTMFKIKVRLSFSRAKMHFIMSRLLHKTAKKFTKIADFMVKASKKALDASGRELEVYKCEFDKVAMRYEKRHGESRVF